MTTPAVQQIQSLYQTLNSQERKAVKLFVDKFSGTSSDSATNVRDEDWLLTGILHELKVRGHSYRRVTPKDVPLSYKEKSAFVREQLIEQLSPVFPSPTYSQLLSLGTTVARALAKYLTYPEAPPLGLKFMLNNAHNAFAAIDSSFPGYLQSGMLYMLIQSR